MYHVIHENNVHPLQFCSIFLKQIAGKTSSCELKNLCVIDGTFCEKDVFPPGVFCISTFHFCTFYGNGNATGGKSPSSLNCCQRAESSLIWQVVCFFKYTVHLQYVYFLCQFSNLLASHFLPHISAARCWWGDTSIPSHLKLFLRHCVSRWTASRMR